MAQQTINIGASPNDGTGTPLRTAFQYTNSNFSELYTAVGPSGNNIVVPGNATITGDLTVDTNVLKVDSANNRVGIGTASPSYTLQVLGTSGSVADLCGSGVAGQQTLLRLRTATGNANGLLIQGNVSNDEIFINNFYNAALVFGVTNTEGMRLNSTGLGVGVASPRSKVDCYGTLTVGSNTAPNADFKRDVAISGADSGIGSLNYGARYDASNYGVGALITGQSAGAWTSTSTPGYISFRTTPSSATTPVERLRIDASGNVGVGVTPRAWATGYRALNVGIYTALTDSQGGETYLTNNAYYDTVDSRWEAVTNNRALRYDQDTADGGHKWYSAPSVAANAALVWSTPMILDASGNLIWSPASTPPTLTTNGQLTVNATSNTNLRFSYRGSDGVTRVANITLA